MSEEVINITHMNLKCTLKTICWDYFYYRKTKQEPENQGQKGCEKESCFIQDVNEGAKGCEKESCFIKDVNEGK